MTRVLVPAALAAALGVLNLAADLPTANAESAAEDVSAAAYLTGPVQQEVSFDGVVATIVEVGEDTVTVSLRNPGAEAVQLDARVEVWTQSGNMMSRMGPMAFRQQNLDLVRAVPAHETVEVVLPVRVEEPTLTDEELMFGAFATTELALRPRDGGIDDATARLRLASAEAVVADLEG